MGNADQDSTSSGVRGRDFLTFTATQEKLNRSERDQAGSVMNTRLPPMSDFLNLGSQAHLIELFPMAAYAVRAPDGVIAWYNSRAAELWGRVPAIGDTDERFCGAYKLYHGDGTHMAHCDTPVALALETGASVHEQEVIIEKPDGSRVTVSVHIDPIRDQNGAIVGVVNFFHDIHERKQAERTTGLLAAIVDSSDDAIISKTLEGVITSWNAGAERLFGYAANEAVGRHISMIIPLDRRHEETSILARLSQGERIDHFDTIRVRKDGSKLEISLTISPVRDASGKIIGASKIARDIGGRKRIERELHESEQRLRVLADALDTQVQFRTQELLRRNAEIVEQSDRLRDLSARLMRIQDEERRRIALDLHDSAGQNLAALGMAIAGMEGDAKRDPVQFSESIKDAKELIRSLTQEIRTTSYLLHPPMLDECGLSSTLRWYVEGLAQRSDLSIEVHIPEDLGRFNPDVELAIFRLVQESLTNVHRHSGSKTAVICVRRQDDKIYADVQDRGKGMSRERFAAVQSQMVGVGIRGMKERVRQSHGELTIDSNALGTKITAVFPIARVTGTVDSV